jgi:hypothetical protein
MRTQTNSDAALAKISKGFSDHLHANQPENRPSITQEQADEIFRSSSHFDQLDDAGPDHNDGYLYLLQDGSMVLIDWSGKVTHSAD